MPVLLTATASLPARRAFAWVAVAAALVAAPVARAGDALRVAATRAAVSLPLYVAQHEGYFADEGLDVALVDCIGGSRCLKRLLEGGADVATTSEMPVVLHAFERPDVAIVATMTTASDNLKLIARRASGVVRSEQLDGRKVGVVAGTAAQYRLETHLLDIGVDPRHVTMVPVPAEDTVAALRDGRVDAVAVWEPYGYAALHGDGAEPVGLRLPLAGVYIENYNLVVGAKSAPPDAQLARLLRAVERAEQFIAAHPAQARTVLRDRLALDARFVDWVWNGLAFRLSLDQALLDAMDSEARWAQREGHVATGVRPNALALTRTAPLKSVKPVAVGIGN